MITERSKKHLATLYPPFADKVAAVLNLIGIWITKHRPGFTVSITDGRRTAKEQNELFALGRTKKGNIVTYKDGYTTYSLHQLGGAVDIALFTPDKQANYTDLEFYRYLGHCARSVGLFWGGDWRKFKDYPHIEMAQTKELITWYKNNEKTN
jgi:peptidoglycan L-alanyl-D-glutamate endopeptidase CwlK